MDYGDTNSTLAAALATAKIYIPVFRVEEGTHFDTLDGSERVNRIVADHVSSCLMLCTGSAVQYLAQEGLTEKIPLADDPMKKFRHMDSGERQKCNDCFWKEFSCETERVLLSDLPPSV